MFTRKPASAKPADGIPRSLPFQPPPNLQADLERTRRLCQILLASLAIVVVLSVAVFVYLRGGTSPSAPAVDADAAKSSAPALAAAPKSGGEKPGAAFKSFPDTRETPAKKAGSPAAALETKLREPLLETIGGLAALQLYQSYLNIGLLADAVESEAYSRTEAISIMLTITELVNLADKQLHKLAPSSLTEDDLAAMENVRLLSSLLRTQSNALLSYWASEEESHATRYQVAREQSWAALKEMLGLDD